MAKKKQEEFDPYFSFLKIAIFLGIPFGVFLWFYVY